MILGIESSCDESAVALFSEKKGVIGEWIHSQIELHREYGGVVPALASREHLEAFGPLLEMMQARLEMARVERIAVTCGPGLAGCLALGIALAKALALVWEVPVVGVNHLRGHAFSPFINVHKEDPKEFLEAYKGLLPHLGLIVSGGNTLLFKIDEDGKIAVIAQTVDDAAGEALDKGAKLLGMAYPGGPLIEKEAEAGDRKAFDFPKAFSKASERCFSFSGLKTSLRYRLEKMADGEVEAQLADICASYQEAVVQALVNKMRQVARGGRFNSLGLSGGVANNKRLRELLKSLSQEVGVPLYVAEPKHSGDNAAMIAFAAYVDPVGTIESKDFDLSFQASAGLIQAE